LHLGDACSEVEALVYFDTWIGVMAEMDGKADFRWAAIPEKNDENGSMVLHVFIGGRDTHRRWEWMEGWKRDVTRWGFAESRRLSETKKLQGLMKFLVFRKGCGIRTGGKWGTDLSIQGND
jgi:hypothetical protein